MAKEKTINELILLVGSNPLPNFISALIFRPQKIWLCYSEQTRQVKEQLERVLKREHHLNTEDVYIPNAGDPKAVVESLDRIEIGGETYLNYTGGTKVMAAQARIVFEKKGGDKSKAFYIYEPEGLVFFDDGRAEEISIRSINPEVIFELHGVEVQETKGKRLLLRPTFDNAKEIARKVLGNPGILKDLGGLHRDERGRMLSPLKAKSAKVNLKSEFGFELPFESFPEEGWNKHTYETWWKFLHGVWLEVLIGGFVEMLFPDHPVRVGVNCRKDGRQFEIDVIHVRNFRLYVISCTTSQEVGLCKSKLFEVSIRARQLGGDLARSALVSMLSSQKRDEVQKDVGELWDAPNTPRVFGIDDLKEWLDEHFVSLKEWLDS